MEIRPALQQAAPISAPSAVNMVVPHPSTAVSATAGLPADNSAMRWASPGAQLQDALQAAEPTQAPVSMQPGEPFHSVSLQLRSLFPPSTCFALDIVQEALKCRDEPSSDVMQMS